jgi:hypothetical protein
MSKRSKVVALFQGLLLHPFEMDHYFAFVLRIIILMSGQSDLWLAASD